MNVLFMKFVNETLAKKLFKNSRFLTTFLKIDEMDLSKPAKTRIPEIV